MSKKKNKNNLEPLEYEANIFGLPFHVIDYVTPVKNKLEKITKDL